MADPAGKDMTLDDPPAAPTPRPANAADLAELLALYATLGGRDPAPDTVAARAAWARMLETGGMTAFVHALPDGSLVASCTLVIVPNLTRGARPWGIIENVVTLPAHRGQGLGKAVVQAAIGAARQAGCYKVALATGRTDEATLRFYESAGLTRGGKTYFEARWP